MFRMFSFASRNLLPTPEASAKIFGTRVGDGLQSGWKILRKQRAGPALNLWYDFPKHLDKMKIPALVNESIAVRQERRVRRMRRGLMPVKKGQGKRQQARKGTSKSVATPQAPAAAAKADKGTAK
jgi:hypothetical protein